jgi:membrane-bound lytic murein transglycosylase D
MNALSSNVLRRNTDIFFRVPVKDSLKYAQFNQLSNNEKNAVSGHSDYIPPKPQAPKIITAPTGKLIYYTIKSGDTLWDIAQKYNTSYQKIQAWNNIGENLQLGQKIKIYLEDK